MQPIRLTYLTKAPIKPQYTWEWGIYRAAGLFNNVIEGIEGLDGAAETENGKAVIAQAKAGRAWSYMVGGLGYGPMYNPNGDNSTKQFLTALRATLLCLIPTWLQQQS